MEDAAPGRVTIYGIENRHGTPIYVHAKTCLVDDTWATIGSDNFNCRSWTHDSELSAVVVNTSGDYARRLRLTLAAEHLDRDPGDSMTDCADPADMFKVYADSAAALDAWHSHGRTGPGPPGRLRRLRPPELGRITRAIASAPYLLLHDPDGRPRSLRRRDAF